LIGAPLPASGLALIGRQPLALQRPLEGPRPSPLRLRSGAIYRRKVAALGATTSAAMILVA